MLCVYTKCLGSLKSRCVVFDAGEEVTKKKVTYFKLECDHDGHEFREVGVELGIVQLRGRKPIHTLDVFPLQYHTVTPVNPRILISGLFSILQTSVYPQLAGWDNNIINKRFDCQLHEV